MLATKPTRTCRLQSTPQGRLLTLRQGREVDQYLVSEVQRPGTTRTFTLARQTTYSESGTTYQTTVASNGQYTCTCPGCRRWAHCKHCLSVQALINSKRL